MCHVFGSNLINRCEPRAETSTVYNLQISFTQVAKSFHLPVFGGRLANFIKVEVCIHTPSIFVQDSNLGGLKEKKGFYGILTGFALISEYPEGGSNLASRGRRMLHSWPRVYILSHLSLVSVQAFGKVTVECAFLPNLEKAKHQRSLMKTGEDETGESGDQDT